MQDELLEHAFEKIGARLKVEEGRSSRFLRPKATALRLDVRRDKKGGILPRFAIAGGFHAPRRPSFCPGPYPTLGP